MLRRLVWWNSHDGKEYFVVVSANESVEAAGALMTGFGRPPGEVQMIRLLGKYCALDRRGKSANKSSLGASFSGPIDAIHPSELLNESTILVIN